MRCGICGYELNFIKKLDHRILGASNLMACGKCRHLTFLPADAAKRSDGFFSGEYARIQKHIDGIPGIFKCRRYFIDLSRLVLLSHFKFLTDDMNILELGPGFPGMFHQLKLTGRGLQLFAIEPEGQCRKMLENYGVKVMGSYFPSGEYTSYQKRFDVIFACNILYYFDDPVVALKQMLSLLSKDGVILIDIVNNEIIDDAYYEENTMVSIFSKLSLRVAVEKAGGTCRFLDTCSVKDPDAVFNTIEGDHNGLRILMKKVKNKIKMETQRNVMKYLARVPELKYGDPQGQYIRAIVGKNT